MSYSDLKQAAWEANMELVSVTPQLNLYNREWPIHSAAYDDPPAKFVFDEPGRRGNVVQAMLSGGCIIAGGFAKVCVIGRNVVLHSGSDVRDSIIMDNVDIGRDAKVRRAIIDKNVRIAPGVQIGYDEAYDRQVGVVSPTGIVVIPKASVPLDLSRG